MKVKNRLRKAIKSLNLYNDSACGQFINYLKKIHNISDENILVGHGSTEILKKIINRIRPKGVLIPLPVHNRYRALMEKLSIETITFYNGGFFDKTYDLKGLKGMDDKPELIILPNPHNITGKIIDKDGWDELVLLSEENKKLIIIDESLIDYTDAATDVSKVITSNFILIIRTFSTFYAMAGIPFGYIMGNKDIISSIKDPVEWDFFSISQLAYVAAKTALKDKHFRKRTIEFLKNEKAYMMDKLSSCENLNIIDSGCNFLLLRAPCDKATLKKELMKKKINVDIYSVPEGLFIRFPLQKHKYNAYVVKTLKQLVSMQQKT
ncbi:MAG: aminotransferase class I/II-fold pyridoxal phosphate-dependent enzyme [Syntrophorhabdaceae bacterium]|nr:aminotransferase class I/II-fold pyridoxal phosphate-dependent enzyme [Syntrophorhabdaceae bacterium]